MPALPIHAHNAHCAFFVMHGSHTCIDCERSTIDEECLESRRSFLPKPHKLEYMIFGKFKTQTGGSSFKDTYFFTLRELKEVGLTKPQIRLALEEYEELLATVESEEMGDISSEEEAGEERRRRGRGRAVRRQRRLWGMMWRMVWRRMTTTTATTATTAARPQRGGTGWCKIDRCLRSEMLHNALDRT